jgi:hypothetical protein
LRSADSGIAERAANIAVDDDRMTITARHALDRANTYVDRYIRNNTAPSRILFS